MQPSIPPLQLRALSPGPGADSPVGAQAPAPWSSPQGSFAAVRRSRSWNARSAPIPRADGSGGGFIGLAVRYTAEAVAIMPAEQCQAMLVQEAQQVLNAQAQLREVALQQEQAAHMLDHERQLVLHNEARCEQVSHELAVAQANASAHFGSAEARLAQELHDMRASHAHAEHQIQHIRQDLEEEWLNQAQTLQGERARQDQERRSTQAQMHTIVSELADE